MDETLGEESTCSNELDQDVKLIPEEQFEITEEMMPSISEAETLHYTGHASDMSNVVVIAHDASASSVISDEPEEPDNKRMYLESVGQDGQTYVLTLQNGAEALRTGQVGFDHKLQGTMAQLAVATSQVVEGATGFTSEESDVNQAWFTSREDKSNLQNKGTNGHLWKQGMWSKEEVELLEQNINSYCKDHGVGDPAEIVFEMTKDERKDFYRTVAKGLNRPLFSVYRRVIRMYDNKNHIGKYTPEEIEKLRELRIKHGNDWQTIGFALGRSASSIKDRCRLMKDNCNTGKWLPSEERRLADAVYQLSRKKPGEMVTSGISWSAVAEKVGTRSEKQCRTKWLNYLNWKQVGGAVWTREDDINLVCKICSLSVNEENSVDWNELAKGWPSVRSPQWLRGKWWNLKRLVIDAQTMSFTDVCEYLYKHLAQSVKFSADSESASPEEKMVVADTLNVPHVNVTQTSNLMETLPLHMKTEASTTSSASAVTLDENVTQSSQLGTTFQTLEFIHPGVHVTPANNSATFLITPGQTAIPFSSCSSNSSGQIVIHALPSNENVTVQMNMSSQIIISTGTPLGTGGLATPVHFVGPLLPTTNASLQTDSISAPTATLLTSASTEEFLSPNLHHHHHVKCLKNDLDIASQTDLVISQEAESEEEIEQDNESTSQRNEAVATDDSTSSHLILADPMLSSNNSPELVENALDADGEKIVTADQHDS